VRTIALVRAGKSIADRAHELGLSKSCLYLWVNQDRIDHGETAGLKSNERAELTSARRRIRELKVEIEIIPRASEIFTELNPSPKESSR